MEAVETTKGFEAKCLVPETIPSSTRQEFRNTCMKVLNAFKSLHRARTTIFQGDDFALQNVRSQINGEFQKHKHVKDESAIKELVKLSRDVELELRQTVVQAEEVRPGVYEVKIREETAKFDNTPFQDVPEEVLLRNRKKASKKCKETNET